jgi:hypothetical protein
LNHAIINLFSLAGGKDGLCTGIYVWVSGVEEKGWMLCVLFSKLQEVGTSQDVLSGVGGRFESTLWVTLPIISRLLWSDIPSTVCPSPCACGSGCHDDNRNQRTNQNEATLPIP